MSRTIKQPRDDADRPADVRFDDRSNVLVLTPSLADLAQGACHDRLGPSTTAGHDRITVRFTHSAGVRDRRRADGDPDGDRGLDLTIEPEPSAVSPPADDRFTVETVSSPANLTEIGVSLSKHLPAFRESDAPTVACVSSITALLQYVDNRTAYKFLNELAHRFASIDAIAHYHLDPNAHDEQVISTFCSLFDAAIEVGENGKLSHRGP